jgi:hypothetical protein
VIKVAKFLLTYVMDLCLARNAFYFMLSYTIVELIKKELGGVIMINGLGFEDCLQDESFQLKYSIYVNNLLGADTQQQ